MCKLEYIEDNWSLDDGHIGLIFELWFSDFMHEYGYMIWATNFDIICSSMI